MIHPGGTVPHVGRSPIRAPATATTWQPHASPGQRPGLGWPVNHAQPQTGRPEGRGPTLAAWRKRPRRPSFRAVMCGNGPRAAPLGLPGSSRATPDPRPVAWAGMGPSLRDFETGFLRGVRRAARSPRFHHGVDEGEAPAARRCVGVSSHAHTHAQNDCVQEQTSWRQNHVATSRLLPIEDAQVDVTQAVSQPAFSCRGGGDRRA